MITSLAEAVAAAGALLEGTSERVILGLTGAGAAQASAYGASPIQPFTYTDSAGNRYLFGFGLNWQGVLPKK